MTTVKGIHIGCVLFPILLALSGSGCVSTVPVGKPDMSEGSQSTLHEEKKENETPGAESGVWVVEDERSVFFAFGSSLVDASGLAKLRRHADYLLENESRRVTLVGHTDNHGSRTFNLTVAEKRVNEVRRLLRSYGVAAVQIQRYAVGNEKMPQGCKTEACRKKMRRVDLVFSH